MRYADGVIIQIGDQVTLGDRQQGVVVGIIGEGRYADGYNEIDWRYLGDGLLVRTDFGDLRLDGPDEDLELVAAADPRRRHA